VGDCVAVMPGASVPFILRPRGDSTSRSFHLIVPCYSYGGFHTMSLRSCRNMSSADAYLCVGMMKGEPIREAALRLNGDEDDTTSVFEDIVLV